MKGENTYSNKWQDIKDLYILLDLKYIITGIDKADGGSLFIVNRDDPTRIVHIQITPIPENFFNNDNLHYVFEDMEVFSVSYTEEYNNSDNLPKIYKSHLMSNALSDKEVNKRNNG